MAMVYAGNHLKKVTATLHILQQDKSQVHLRYKVKKKVQKEIL